MPKPSDLLADDPRRILVDPERLKQLDYAQRIAGKPKKGIYNAELKGPEPLWKRIIGGMMGDIGLGPMPMMAELGGIKAIPKQELIELWKNVDWQGPFPPQAHKLVPNESEVMKWLDDTHAGGGTAEWLTKLPGTREKFNLNQDEAEAIYNKWTFRPKS